MTFGANIAGKIVQATGGLVYSYNKYGKLAATTAAGSTVTVTLTGWSWLPNGSSTALLQTTSGGWIDPDDGWQAVGQKEYSARDAQYYVNQVIRNNKTILENNLVCARFAYKLTAEEKQTLYGLQTRLQERNNSLMNDGLVQVDETSYPAGYADLADSLNSFMTTGGVGVVITTTAVIVISAIVLASLGTAAYFAYKWMASESEKDVKFSKELTRTLTTKLTAEEYQQLKEETAGIVTRAKLVSSISTIGTIGKVALIGTAGWLIYSYIRNRRNG